MSRGFELGYEMEYDESGLGEPEKRGKAAEEYYSTLDLLQGAAKQAFEEAMERGREEAKQDVKFES